MIARRASLRSAPWSSIAPLSRSDHNAATPSMMNRCGSRAHDDQLGSHHVFANTRRSRGSVKPASREADGAKRSGLTEPWTAGQSRVVMAAVRANVPQSANRKAIGARWWRKGRRRRTSAAAVRIQSVCALNLQNAASGQNLTGDESAI